MSEETGQFIMRALTKTFTIAALVLLFTLGVCAQSRTTRIFQRCGDPNNPVPSTPAFVSVTATDIRISPCYQKTITFSDPHNGPWPASGLQWSSLNGLAYNGTAYFDGGDVNIYGGLQIGVAGGTATPNFYVARTITPAGTTGNVTIDKLAGTVNIAAGAGTAGVTVTNARVTVNSIVYAIARTNDATCSVKSVVPAAGSFVLRTTANCTAETSFGFLVTN